MNSFNKILAQVSITLLIVTQCKALSHDEETEGSFVGLLIDIVVGLFLVTFTPAFLWMVEAQVVNYEMIIRRCQIATRKVKDVNEVRICYESRPVHLVGVTRVEPRFAVEDNDLCVVPVKPSARLERTVEMFQWVEEKKDSGSEETYEYYLKWDSADNLSSGFQESQTHWNPPRMPSLYSTTINAPTVNVGAYILCTAQVNMLSNWKRFAISDVPRGLPAELSQLEPTVQQGYLVFNGSLTTPAVGTVRVSYRVVEGGEMVSTVAVQRGLSFRPFLASDAHRLKVAKLPYYQHNSSIAVSPERALTAGAMSMDGRGYSSPIQGSNTDDNGDEGEEETCTSVCDYFSCCFSCAYCLCCQPALSVLQQLANWSIGDGIILLEDGVVDVPDLFRHEWSRFSLRTWVVRLLSYLLLGCGFYMVLFGPIVYVLNFIPYVGWLAGRLLFAAALLVGLLEGLLISAFASALHRPNLLAGTC
jgi:hypothetical protein